MKLYATTDVASSVRKAHQSFTHVVVNRAYTTLKPVYFRSVLIEDLPIYQWASWDSATQSQYTRWRANGGVLIDQNTYSPDPGHADVIVFVECPMNMDRIMRLMWDISEYAVIPRPHTWRVHEECFELRTPTVEKLKEIWAICAGTRMTDEQLAEAAGLPRPHLTYMRNSFKPVEEWEIKPRLKPEFAAFDGAWEWIGKGRCVAKKEVTKAGHKAAVKEMARLGHIVLAKVQRYPDETPDWEHLAVKRIRAREDLNSIRSLVESLPDHLQAE